MSAETITNFVQTNSQPIGSTYHTDEFRAYLALRQFTNHRVVNHTQWYVDGDVHTNGVENFWSLLKRGVFGTYHRLSVKHLGRYLNEFEFRFNNRKSESIFEWVLSGGEGKLLRYKKLTEKQDGE